MKDLRHFHETRGTPFRKSPKISGKEIDLYLLYVVVTARGGWIKSDVLLLNIERSYEDLDIRKNDLTTEMSFIKYVYRIMVSLVSIDLTFSMAEIRRDSSFHRDFLNRRDSYIDKIQLLKE